MKNEMIKIIPYFERRIWGGSELIEEFHFKTKVSPVGESYSVVAIPGQCDCQLEDKEETLSQWYKLHPKQFDCDTEELPIKVNLLYPHEDLSIQLHPDDTYAQKYNGGRGKPEAWVIIKAAVDSQIVYGHSAETKSDFIQLCKERRFSELIRHIPVKLDEFLDIPCGTLHALGKGIVTYNISRNAECTLRLYDYDRLDPVTNRKRDIHITEVIEAVNIPDCTHGFEKRTAVETAGCLVWDYVDEPGLYTLRRYKVDSFGYMNEERFGFITIVNGEGMLDDLAVSKGETIFVPQGYGSLKLKGTMDIFFASYRNLESR